MVNKNFKKKDLAKDLHIQKGFSANLSKKLIDDFIEVIIDNIRTGNLILKNIGSFKILKKKERLGRNPKTKEEFIISSRNSISFTPSDKINKAIAKLHE